jgi:type II secretory pathway pseudopilin PulG
MQRVSSGYTIVEVIIFLAVSAVILAVGVRLVSGQQAQTDFNQKMRDTRSQIQAWLNDVSAGNPGGDVSNQNCKAPGVSKPSINNGSPSVTPDCIFLGKAIQFTDPGFSQDQAGNLYAYSIFGRRLSATTNQLPTNLADASPIAATAQGSGSADFTQTFSLAPAWVKKVTSLPNAGSHLIGFFSSFNTPSSPSNNGVTDLDIDEYNFNGSGTPGNQPGGNAVDKCMQLNGCSATPLQSFKFCLTDGRRYAQITISSPNGTGARTSLDYITAAAC